MKSPKATPLCHTWTTTIFIWFGEHPRGVWRPEKLLSHPAFIFVHINRLLGINLHDMKHENNIYNNMKKITSKIMKNYKICRYLKSEK